MTESPEEVLGSDIFDRANKYPSLAPLQGRKRGEITQLLEVLERGWEFIHFPARQLRVDDKGRILAHTRSGEKHIGDCPVPYPKTVTCTIEHDLVTVIQGTKDVMLKSDHHLIGKMRDILLRLAGSRKMRDILWQFRVNNLRVLGEIGASKNISQNEPRAESMYAELIKKLKLSADEQALIENLSWEWKVLPELNFSSYKYSCRMWILYHCVIERINYSKS